MTLEIIFLIMDGFVQRKEDNIASVFNFLFFFSYFLCNFFYHLLIHNIKEIDIYLYRQIFCFVNITFFFHAFDIYIFELMDIRF